MKPSQRYHLNRLAETLVTPERFDPAPEWFVPGIPDDVVAAYPVEQNASPYNGRIKPGWLKREGLIPRGSFVGRER